jgi:GR25 family glycosyltransferase involved in LPS biosynthesis/tetratricopeptide (TPR) repeat protein
MIVKNEAHVIEATFDNLCKYIQFDYWVIADTGSTDGTQDVIRNYFAKKGIPGEVVEHVWQDFGHNRTLSLRAGYNKSDYLLIFDADDSIHGDFKLPSPMNMDCYTLKFGQGFSYLRPQLINNRKKWSYVGVLHEYLKREETTNGEKLVEGDYYIESGKTGDRSKDPLKYFKDANILKAAYAKEKAAGSDLANRYAFYCAQSFKDARHVDDAIEWYCRVVDELTNWAQEKYYSCMMLGNLFMQKGNFTKSLHYLLKASHFDPERIECVNGACQLLRSEGMHELVILLYKKYRKYNKDPLGKLFLFRDNYDGLLEFNACISATHVNEKALGYDCAKFVILNSTLENDHKNTAFDCLRFYLNELMKDSDSIDIFYALSNFMSTASSDSLPGIWNALFNKHKSHLISPTKSFKPKSKDMNVFLSFTSCKRFDLFEQTMNSILNHFMDKDQIDQWFCVDDNSSTEDRTMMKKKYPWLVMYNKTPEEKGHRTSMNIIWNKLNELKPKYWIHIEDDFLFHVKKNYVTESIDLLRRHSDIKQVLFNRAYSETVDDYSIRGYTPLEPGFVVHEYKHGDFPYRNCHYWPHYSFRPGVIEVDAILKLGNYDSPNTFFEMDYAHRWVGAGYKSAFFDGINCRHIGRLTKDRNSNTVKNAYELNQESQFAKTSNIKIVNLKRREDRRKEMDKVLEGIDHDFFEAVDGKLLDETEFIYKLFRNNDFGWRRAFIGCALSHYKLWQQLVNDSIHDYYIILEDDITVTPALKDKFKALEGDMKTKDCIFLGYSMFKRNREATKDTYCNNNDPKVVELRKDLYMGGTFMYSITKKGAEAFLKYTEVNGIRHGIDYMMKIATGIELYETQPHIAFSDVYDSTESKTDTDIQNNYSCFDYSFIDKFTFLQGKDHMGDDVEHKKVSNFQNMKYALANKNIVGFNTLGFLKRKASNLVTSPYFGPNDGIFIKKEVPSLVKMICNWQSSEDLVKEWSVMPVSNNIVFTQDDKEAEYFVIINYPQKGAYYDPAKTILFQMEPTVFDPSKKWGAKTWPALDTSRFLHVHNHKSHLNGVQWSFDIKDIPEKKNAVVSIISQKKHDDGHKYRIQLVKDSGSLVEVYGRENYHEVSAYVGSVPDDNRFNVYSQYKYALAIENNSEHNYATEKIWEPILCETLAFYWGCPNLEDYIDSRAFVRLPSDNITEAISIIQKAVSEDWWSQRIDAIREMKKKITSQLGFFPTVSNIIKDTRLVYIGGCVKNCGKYLEKVFDNFKSIADYFGNYEIVIAYDESNDNTLEILERMKQKFNLTVIKGNNKSTQNTENIASARNSILEYVKNRDYRYLIMIDCDDVSCEPIKLDVLDKHIRRTDWDALSFNRPGYYDVWALSIDHFQVSCWHYGPNSEDVANTIRAYVINKLANTPAGELVECQSAFNGFAIYRKEAIKNCNYDWTFKSTLKYIKNANASGDILDTQDCEHRSFHMSMIDKNNARIRISPENVFKVPA